MDDDDETTDFRGILGNLGAQPGGLLAGLFPSQPPYPQGPGSLPFGADSTTISLAAAAGATDLARTLRAINHQAAIMTAFGKAMGAPGTASADPAQGAGTGPSDNVDPPNSSPSGPVLAQRAPAQAASAAPVSANTVFNRSPVPLPMPRPEIPQIPIPSPVEQRWPGLENPDTMTLWQRIAAIPSSGPPKSGPQNLDWSTLPRSTAIVPLPSASKPGSDNPDTGRLLKSVAAVPSLSWSKRDFPTLYQFGIDPDDLVRRIVRAEDASEDPNEKANSSTATGLGQFTDGTWREVFKYDRPDLDNFWTSDPNKKVDPEKDKKILPLRTDPALSRQMTAAYADQNVKALEHANLPITYRNIYLAHFLGPNDAPKLLRADPDALARSVLSAASVRANPRLITPTMTVRDLIQWGEDRMEHGAGWQRPSR